MKDKTIDLRNSPLVAVSSIRSPKYAARDFKGILILNGEIVLRTEKLSHDIHNLSWYDNHLFRCPSL